MPCPYAERRGPVIYCKAIGKAVSPLTHPCLSKNRYTKCKYYRAAEAKKAEKPSAKAQPAEPARPPREAEAPQPSMEATPPQPAIARSDTSTRKTRGTTLDGRPARTCLECIYYGSRTKMCLLLGIEVKDPLRPPCAESQTE
ncbi:MAG: hypothetical protein F7C34_01895 [Desulfurococcales archaeon]|nr:hypothetical protein [Desulfurococcales archaeon]